MGEIMKPGTPEGAGDMGRQGNRSESPVAGASLGGGSEPNLSIGAPRPGRQRKGGFLAQLREKRAANEKAQIELQKGLAAAKEAAVPEHSMTPDPEVVERDQLATSAIVVAYWLQTRPDSSRRFAGHNLVEVTRSVDPRVAAEVDLVKRENLPPVTPSVDEVKDAADFLYVYDGKPPVATAASDLGGDDLVKLHKTLEEVVIELMQKPATPPETPDQG